MHLFSRLFIIEQALIGFDLCNLSIKHQGQAIKKEKQ